MPDDGLKAIFLDRDGTLVEEKEFLTSENDIEVFSFVEEALQILQDMGFLLVVVSNQSGVARGYLTEERVIEINKEIFRRLDDLGVKPDFFFYCPHHPEAEIEIYRIDCGCRKPLPGMVKMAMQLVDIDLTKSVSVGDKISDVQLCQNLGGKGILVLTGHGISEKEKIDSTGVQPDYICNTLLDAAKWIKKNLSVE